MNYNFEHKNWTYPDVRLLNSSQGWARLTSSDVSQHTYRVTWTLGHTGQVRIMDTEPDVFARGIKEAIYIRAL